MFLKKLHKKYVCAVRLDGKGKNFTQRDLQDMRLDLLDLGYTEDEVTKFDDQELIGLWQGETSYLEADD